MILSVIVVKLRSERQEEMLDSDWLGFDYGQNQRSQSFYSVQFHRGVHTDQRHWEALTLSRSAYSSIAVAGWRPSERVSLSRCLVPSSLGPVLTTAWEIDCATQDQQQDDDAQHCCCNDAFVDAFIFLVILLAGYRLVVLVGAAGEPW